MRISDWRSDVCSSDLFEVGEAFAFTLLGHTHHPSNGLPAGFQFYPRECAMIKRQLSWPACRRQVKKSPRTGGTPAPSGTRCRSDTSLRWADARRWRRSEEHTSELQSLMRISYAVFCLKKKNTTHT